MRVDETHEITRRYLVDHLASDGKLAQVLRHEFREMAAELERIIGEFQRGNMPEAYRGLLYLEWKLTDLGEINGARILPE